MIDPDKIEQNIKCVEGTMKLEGLDLTEECHKNLSRFAYGEATFDEIIHDICEKFQKSVDNIVLSDCVRNLTEEESAIYDDWLNAEAEDTGERLF